MTDTLPQTGLSANGLPQNPTETPTNLSPQGIAQAAGPSSTPDPHKLSIVANVAPHLEPAAVAGIAATAKDPNDAAVQAQVAHAYSAASVVAGILRQAHLPFQLTYWDKASGPEKSLLTAAGYVPPTAPQPQQQGGGGSWWDPGTWWHETAHAYDDARHAAASVFDTASQAVSSVYNLTQAPVNRLLRAEEYIAGEQNIQARGALGTNPLALLDPVAIAHAWGQVANGSSSFQPTAVLYVQKVMGIKGATLQLAKLMASGSSLQQALASVPQNERASAFSLIETTPQFEDAVKLLSDSHLDFGQFVFGGISPEQAKQMWGSGVDVGALSATGVATQAFAGAGLAASLWRDPAEGAGFLGAGTRLRNLAALGLGTGTAAVSGVAALEHVTPDEKLTVSPFGQPVHPLSGVADAMWDWYSNPLNIGLAARASRVTAMHGVGALDGAGTAREVQWYYTHNDAGMRAAQKFVSLITTPWRDPATDKLVTDKPNFGALENYGLHMQGMYDEIRAAFPELKQAAEAGTPEEGFAKFWAENQASMNLIRGRAGLFFRDTTLYPHMTVPQSVYYDLRGVARRTLMGRRFDANRLSLRELTGQMLGQADADAAFAAEKSQEKMGTAVRMARRLTGLVPRTPIIDFRDPDLATPLRRFADLALPDNKASGWVNAVMQYDDVGARKLAFRGLVEDVLRNLGLDQTPDGRAFFARWLSQEGFDTEGSLAREKYSHGDNDLVVNKHSPDGMRVPQALLDSQLSNKARLPDFRELYQLSKKSYVMDKLQMGLGAQWWDRFMSGYWKRAVLFRPGFGIRVAGEEALNFMLRTSPQAWIEARIAGSLNKALNPSREAREAIAAALADQTDEDALRILENPEEMDQADAMRLYDAVMGHVPEEARAQITTPEEALAAAQSWWFMRWARKVGVSVVPQDVMDAAANLAKRGVLDTAYSDMIDAISSHTNPYFDDTARGNTQHLIRGEQGIRLSVKPTGYLNDQPRTDGEALAHWSYGLSGVAMSRIGRVAAAAWRRGGRDGMVQALQDWFGGKDIAAELAEAQSALERQREEIRQIEAATGVTSLEDTHPAIGKLEGIGIRVDHLQNKLESRDALLRKFGRYYQDDEGQTVADGISQDKIFRDWANHVTDHVLNLTHTSEPQDFDEEGAPVPTDGPQPIRLLSPLSPLHPYEIKNGPDAGRDIGYAHQDLAYVDVPEGEIRLFHPINTKTARGGSQLAAPGRAWSPSYEWAKERAGEDGTVYEITVPRNMIDHGYTYRGKGDANEYLDRVDAAQHAGEPVRTRSGLLTQRVSGVAPAHEGTFESGDLNFGRDNVPGHHFLIDDVARGLWPNTQELGRIDRSLWPDETVAPSFALKADKEGYAGALVRKGMNLMVGHPVNWLSRQPIFLHNYSVAWREAKAMIEARNIADEDGSLAHDVAMERAYRETIPYIHDPSTRSQFAVIVRNLMPFWFAQEQFYKRWIRLFATYPEAFYKLQLLMNGLRSVGFVTKDAYGQDSFVYPGSQAALSLLTKFPFLGSLPVNVGFSGEINQLNPTLSNGLAPWPSWGPIVTVPLSLTAAMFPETSHMVQTILGPSAPPLTEQGDWTANVINQFAPTIVARLLEWRGEPSGGTIGGPNASPGPGAVDIASPLYMSAAIAAGQQLEAAGHGLTPDQQANPVLTNQFLDRIANWTKNMILLRALFGFMAPATPTFKFNDNGLGAQFSALLATMPYDAAVQAFIKVHPDASAMTIFGSTSSSAQGSGTYVPPTEQAARYINDNLGFFQSYPQLGPWALPASAASGTFNGAAYTEEKGLGLRLPRSLEDWYMDVKYSEAANVYFPMEQKIQAAEDDPNKLAALGVSKEQLQEFWAKWKGSPSLGPDQPGSGFLGTHPIFAQMYVEPTASNRRQAIMAELGQAITAGGLPQNTWGKNVAMLYAGWSNVNDYYMATKDNTAYETQRHDNAVAFIEWGIAFAQLHPEVAPFWNGVMMKAVPGISATSLAKVVPSTTTP